MGIAIPGMDSANTSTGCLLPSYSDEMGGAKGRWLTCPVRRGEERWHSRREIVLCSFAGLIGIAIAIETVLQSVLSSAAQEELLWMVLQTCCIVQTRFLYRRMRRGCFESWGGREVVVFALLVCLAVNLEGH